MVNVNSIFIFSQCFALVDDGKVNKAKRRKHSAVPLYLLPSLPAARLITLLRFWQIAKQKANLLLLAFAYYYLSSMAISSNECCLRLLQNNNEVSLHPTPSNSTTSIKRRRLKFSMPILETWVLACAL